MQLTKIFFIFPLLISLVNPLLAHAQGPNSRASIASDYQQVTIVAHVKVLKADLVEKIGGYLIYRVTADVVELFKGKFPSDTHFVYLMQVEAGYHMERYKGEKVVFVSFHNNDEATEYRALENSDREPYPKVLSILRKLRGKTKKVQ